MTMHRRRAQEVEAVQYTGQELGELLRLLGYVPILLTVGWWYFKDGRCLPDLEFRAEFEPVPAEESGWVAVSERLPELPEAERQPSAFGVQVLIWPHHKGGTEYNNSPIAFYGVRHSDEPNFYLYGTILRGVTHWRPLPAPPAKETE